MTGVDFLREVNLGNELNVNGEVVVIGGGNVAIDVARTALRAGKTNVSMYCLESRVEMPALEEEINEALEEGIIIENSWAPKEIIVKDGKVTAIEFKKCISVFNAEGRFAPVFDEETRKTVASENILVAIGQSMEYGKLLEGTNVVINGNGTVNVDSFTLQTKEDDIFAGGDVATGPRFAIDAIALGKEAAISIHRFVQPGQSLVMGRDRREYKAFDKTDLILEGYDNTKRQRIPHVDGNKAKQSFEDLRDTFTLEQVQKETQRCLSCGATSVDEYVCVGCGACTTRCKFDAISLKRVHDENTVPFEKLKSTVVKNALKRKGKLTIKRLTKALKNE